ncbi:MAG: beta-galactosidase GalA [Nibricoccus sp.]
MLLRPWIAAVCFAVACVTSFAAAEISSPRERLSFDADWRFSFGHAFDTSKDFDHATSYFSYVAKAGYGDGPAAPKFDDRAWRQLDLPHDWAVEAPFAGDGSHSHGYKAIGRRYPERSVGWYRKTFHVSASDLGRRVSIEFEGVFRDSVVWVNGFYLGRQPSASTGFCYDLTDYLNYGGENVITVRADATLEEGWYYEGAGIYRHVWLTKTSPLHVPMWGTFVATTLQSDSAEIAATVTVVNDGVGGARFVVEQIVEDPDGGEVARSVSEEGALAAGGKSEVTQVMKVSNPRLWSVDIPARYRLVTLVRSEGKIVDRYETPFGIRSVRFDPNQGFFLNGNHVLLKGVNLHQDHAGVGVALPDALHEFRLRRLKEMGCNAVRTSHEPPSPAFLDACDRLGVLVIDENRLMGPSPEQLRQLEAMIRRDRNHPSVIIWSVGNEEWAIEGNEKGARITASMQAVAQRLDPTRRTTVAISGGWGAGSSTTADVMGYNYYTHGSTDEQHRKFPEQPGIGTEETTTQCTRGVYFTDRKRGHLAHDPDGIGDSGGNCIKGWKHYAERPYLAGLFYWTGLDYRGEPTPFAYPTHSTQFGLLDSCGFAKDSFYYLQAWWTDRPVLHIYPHWNWTGREGQSIKVGCYTNHDEVELFLNGASLGKKAMPRNDRVEWTVAYAPGTIEARGYRAGKLVETARVETTGPATQLVLTPDRTTITADGTDATVFAVEARDAQGRVVPTACLPAKFTITGGKILGVGNGDPSCLEPDQYHPTYAFTPVAHWRGCMVAANTKEAAATELKPLMVLGDWKAPLPKPGELYELAADFSTSSLTAGATLDLFLPSLGSKTTVWLNGREMARDLDTTLVGPSLKLDATMLVAGENHVRLLVTPFEDGRRRLPQSERLGTLRVTTAAPQVQRDLFNGLAQVIVQAPRNPGDVRLVVEAEGLKSATATVKAVSGPRH